MSVPLELIKFFDGSAWKILKKTKIGLEIAHDIVSAIVKHSDLCFIDDCNNVTVDPNGFHSTLSECEKRSLHQINSGNDKGLKLVNGKVLVKKIGSAVAMKVVDNNTGDNGNNGNNGNNDNNSFIGPETPTELVYASTFVPFDSSF